MATFKEDLGRPEGLTISQTTPASEPITSTEVKLHLKIDYSTDDTLIDRLIQMAREFVEGYLQRALINRTVTAEWTRHGKRMHLPLQPSSAITSVTWLYSDGTTEALTLNSEYFVDGSSDKSIRITPSYNGLRVVYTAGYGANSSSVPAIIKEAMLRIVANYYEYRTDNIEGVAPLTDMNTFRMLSTFRNPVV